VSAVRRLPATDENSLHQQHRLVRWLRNRPAAEGDGGIRRAA
jgi:hypothetical protein